MIQQLENVKLVKEERKYQQVENVKFVRQELIQLEEHQQHAQRVEKENIQQQDHQVVQVVLLENMGQVNKIVNAHLAVLEHIQCEELQDGRIVLPDHVLQEQFQRSFLSHSPCDSWRTVSYRQLSWQFL